MIEFKQVTKVFRDSGEREIVAVDDMSFEVRTGEMLALILAGAVPAAVLALAVDFLLARMEGVLAPRGA